MLVKEKITGLMPRSILQCVRTAGGANLHGQHPLAYCTGHCHAGKGPLRLRMSGFCPPQCVELPLYETSI